MQLKTTTKTIPLQSLIDNPELGENFVAYLTDLRTIKVGDREEEVAIVEQTDKSLALLECQLTPIVDRFFLGWLPQRLLEKFNQTWGTSAKIEFILPDEFAAQETAEKTLESAIALFGDRALVALHAIANRAPSGLDLVERIASLYKNSSVARGKILNHADKLYAER